MTDPATAPFSIRGILRRSIAICWRHPVPIFGLTTVLALPGSLLFEFSYSPVDEPFAIDPFLMAASFIANEVATTAIELALCFGVLRALGGGRLILADSLRLGRGAVATVVVLMVGFTIVGTIALLLIVPLIILAAMFWVVFPVAIVERRGIIDSCRRSLDLTRGYRRRLSGLLLAELALFVVAGVIVSTPSVFIDLHPIVVFLQGWLLAVLAMVLFIVVTIVTYHDLRAAKEGPDSAVVDARD